MSSINYKESAYRIVLAHLSQPLVGIPPYRGDFLQYLKEKNKIKNSKFIEDEIKEGYEGVFVIHDHKATTHHWDLRLEFPSDSGKVLRSWTIPKHKMPKGKEKLLALEMKPHAFSYKDFEGTVPEGQEGAGEVKIYDKGTFVIKKVEFDKVYKIKFKGDKLKGTYNIIKMKDKDFLWSKSKDD